MRLAAPKKVTFDEMFWGGVIGAITGTVISSIIWFFITFFIAPDGFAFVFGLYTVGPLGAISGSAFGIWCAYRIDWNKQKTIIITRYTASVAAIFSVATFLWLVLRDGYFQDGISEGTLLVSVPCILIAAVIGGIIGAVAGSVLSLFVKPAASVVAETSSPEDVWPPPPANRL